MSQYIMRLDDACEKRDVIKWDRMENLLDKYQVKPLVGIIPDCRDSKMDAYVKDENFWNRVKNWNEKGWVLALHGYNHVYGTKDCGINPVNSRSEFAGEPIEIQKEKIRKGVAVFRSKGFNPLVFFAPAHTFDLNTIEALKLESDIRIVSDTIAWKPYKKYDVTFIPQQIGNVRKLPFGMSTFCYHPNTMSERSFENLEMFLQREHKKFISFPLDYSAKEESLLDVFLRFCYFKARRCKQS